MNAPAEAPSDVAGAASSAGFTGRRAFGAFFADLIALTKPRVTGLVIATTGCGIWLAARMQSTHRLGLGASAIAPSWSTLCLAMLGTILVVSGANALNMYLERDTDALMERTRKRPLPSGRLSPELALWFGIALSSSALSILFSAVNVMTGALAAFALGVYVLLYTPLKRVTTAALPIGAVPGAIPPLLGWTAVTARPDAPGVALFSILFLWQIPHFLAIATFRRGDYQRAGLKVLPVVRGDRTTRIHILLYLPALIATSFVLPFLGVTGLFYTVAAAVLGLGFFVFGALGLRPSAGNRWARWLFAISIVYLVFLLTALLISA